LVRARNVHLGEVARSAGGGDSRDTCQTRPIRQLTGKRICGRCSAGLHIPFPEFSSPPLWGGETSRGGILPPTQVPATRVAGRGGAELPRKVNPMTELETLRISRQPHPMRTPSGIEGVGVLPTRKSITTLASSASSPKNGYAAGALPARISIFRISFPLPFGEGPGVGLKETSRGSPQKGKHHHRTQKPPHRLPTTLDVHALRN